MYVNGEQENESGNVNERIRAVPQRKHESVLQKDIKKFVSCNSARSSELNMS